MPGVYISYPFCEQKCTFCNFASDVRSSQAVIEYEAALREQLEKHVWQWAPNTLYLGGGTPSLMRPAFLGELLHLIPLSPDAEFTMECAPGTLSQERVHHWHACGVNRISLGVQSFVTEELRRTGRRHTAETVEADVLLLRAAGIDNINVDLIAGLPGQTEASWQQSLEGIRRLQPPHASVYLFEVDDDSRLGREMLNGGSRYGAAAAPSDDMAAEFYCEAVTALGSLGLERYEISNFAKAGYQSRHNLKYWELEPYVGFGLDAHSYDGMRRWQTPDSLINYLQSAGAGSAIEELAADREEEHLFVGLRLASGIVLSPAERERFRQPIAKWTEAGLLIEESDHLRLSHEGVLLSNEVLQEFINV